ncbi:MAG: TetR family transcriptional regulator [Verrucomicrobiales bacterium]|nr:TetR family transcriptional regulator [Verrucomicrobiales bacterium]|tara:strand:- start:8 stop:634 length:627 start_codon:yes stop_codon:yes gene_type:complete
MKQKDTKTIILDAAEELFARRGPNATSLRQVIGRAKVNLAAVHYHFGSKESLLQSVLARRLVPLNAERLALLEEAERRSRRVSLEKILEALVGPALRLSRDPNKGGREFMRLLGRCFTEPDEKIQELLNRQVAAVAERFMPAFQKALPKVPQVDLLWRLHFLVGAMAHTMADAERLGEFSGGLCDPDDTEGMIQRLVTFLAAGLKAKA